jgi:E3 ubiquitin-protein ligase MARCH6
MRGPLYGVFQNVGISRESWHPITETTTFQAALMIFVLDTAIGLGVWIPFTIGKSTALLSASSSFDSVST